MLREKTDAEFLNGFEKVYLKISTMEGFIYTVCEYSKDQIMILKKEMEEARGNSITVEEAVKEIVSQDLENLVRSKEDLFYIPYEAKIINRNIIKETLIVYK